MSEVWLRRGSRDDWTRGRRDPRASADRFGRLQRPCPTCGALGARIVYGYPSDQLLDAAGRGQIVLGGCTYRAATHRCANGHEWASPDLPS